MTPEPDPEVPVDFWATDDHDDTGLDLARSIAKSVDAGTPAPPHHADPGPRSPVPSPMSETPRPSTSPWADWSPITAGRWTSR